MIICPSDASISSVAAFVTMVVLDNIIVGRQVPTSASLLQSLRQLMLLS